MAGTPPLDGPCFQGDFEVINSDGAHFIVITS